jgi:hypothetical protein
MGGRWRGTALCFAGPSMDGPRTSDRTPDSDPRLELAQPPLPTHMSPWLGLSSSARRGPARGASGLASARTARKIPPLWAALRRLPPRHARAGSGGCSSTFHGRLGAGVTISIDAVPSVFNSGLLRQHPICRSLFNRGRGVQGNSHAITTAAATAANSSKAVQEVYERFETACDDLDSGLFDRALDQHCYCCMQFFGGAGGSESRLEGGHRWCSACSYHVHGKGKHGGKHTEFATTERPNDRCSGCSGCSY